MITEVDSNDCPTVCVCDQLTCLLLDLVAAVGSGVADDELQLLASVVHKLSLEGPLLGLGGPRDSLVDIKEPIQTHRQGNQTPAHCLPDLHTKKTSGVAEQASFPHNTICQQKHKLLHSSSVKITVRWWLDLVCRVIGDWGVETLAVYDYQLSLQILLIGQNLYRSFIDARFSVWKK